MNFLDAVFTLAIGLLLVAQPRAFFKFGGEPQDLVKKQAYVRKLGYVLIGAGILLGFAAMGHR